jgi:hypothetical protein
LGLNLRAVFEKKRSPKDFAFICHDSFFVSSVR